MSEHSLARHNCQARPSSRRRPRSLRPGQRLRRSLALPTPGPTPSAAHAPIPALINDRFMFPPPKCPGSRAIRWSMYMIIPLRDSANHPQWLRPNLLTANPPCPWARWSTWPPGRPSSVTPASSARRRVQCRRSRSGCRRDHPLHIDARRAVTRSPRTFDWGWVAETDEVARCWSASAARTVRLPIVDGTRLPPAWVPLPAQGASSTLGRAS